VLQEVGIPLSIRISHPFPYNTNMMNTLSMGISPSKNNAEKPIFFFFS
jgi:hypothetical protein